MASRHGPGLNLSHAWTIGSSAAERFGIKMEFFMSVSFPIYATWAVVQQAGPKSYRRRCRRERVTPSGARVSTP
ncbi:hypothetical protein GCM10011600_12070 [Pseudolysinimonas yzui]|uniref:Uncharacterized protein n=1 Tax=Pseudolysinimonas yzui TaxID=2708254 RepID=A0A8J3GPU7_9MICO|nr:hypothetical protein GCM10011600_12070 [Pseudolysinimonas yzui]